MTESGVSAAPALRWWELASARAMLAVMIGGILWVAIAAIRAPAPETGAARIIPPTNVPRVEPLRLRAVSTDDARQINAATPFTTAPIPPARPFIFRGSVEDQGRAIDCLAAAIHYEAGNETNDGQEAVAQVILNRVRHPAYPGTVCGVVFQGSERRTGCQFTFTCDGAMARGVSAEGWARARSVATAMLAGKVYKPVGLATHYHTDWVSPVWSAKLDKVRAEGTHLFLRWAGYWGTPGAFRGRHAGGEPAVAQLAAFSANHGAAAAELTEIAAAPATEIAGAPATSVGSNDSFILIVDRATLPASLTAMAEAKCGALDYCKVLAWTDRAAAPTGFPVPEAKLAALSFSFLRNRAQGFEKPLWNCTVFAGVEKRNCMRPRVTITIPARSAADTPPIARTLQPAANP